MKKLKFIYRTLHILFILITSMIKAQFYYDLNIGPKVGVNMATISKTFESIYRPGYENYTWDEKPVIGFNFGAFLNYKFNQGKIGIQPEVYYSQEQFEDKYADVEGLKYTLRFKTNYVQLNALLKYYPTGGLNIGIGPQLGLLTTEYPLDYKSNGFDESTTDELVTRLLNEGFNFKSNFQVVFSLGYEFQNGLSIDARYNLGLADVMETVNGEFGWSEQKNTLSTFQFQIAYGFSLQP